MFQRLAILAVLLAALAGGAKWLLDLSVGRSADATSAGSDEDWRRTNQGWERLSPRIISARSRELAGAAELAPASSTSFGDKQTVIWQLHPGGLAVFLVLGSAAALYLLPGGNSSVAGRQSQTLF